MPPQYKPGKIKISNVENIRKSVLSGNRVVAIGTMCSMDCDCSTPVKVEISFTNEEETEEDFIIECAASIQVDKLITSTALGTMTVRHMDEPLEVSSTTLGLSTGSKLARNVGYL